MIAQKIEEIPIKAKAIAGRVKFQRLILIELEIMLTSRKNKLLRANVGYVSYTRLPAWMVPTLNNIDCRIIASIMEITAKMPIGECLIRLRSFVVT